MQYIIQVSILCVLIGWLIHIRYKEVCDKRECFPKEYYGFTMHKDFELMLDLMDRTFRDFENAMPSRYPRAHARGT